MHGSCYYLPDIYHVRTNDSVIQIGEKAENLQQAFDGIKRTSVLRGTIDLVESVPIDHMHCMLESVMKG